MIQTLPETDRDLLAVRISGTFTDEDLTLYEELIREKVQQYGAVRLYFEMEGFEGWSVSSFLKNGVFDIVHGDDFNRVVMVGEKEWQHLASRVASPVKKKGIKYFSLSEKNEALNWLQNDPDRINSN